MMMAVDSRLTLPTADSKKGKGEREDEEEEGNREK